MDLIHASALDTSPPEYLVEGMLPDFGTGFIYGASYTGKSFVAGVKLCLAIANGTPYLGHRTVQGSAVWAIGEGLQDAGPRIRGALVDEHGLRHAQAAQIAQKQGQEAADEWLASLPPYADDRMYVYKKAFQVPFTASNDPTAELRRAAEELSLVEDLRLIVLDTARRFSSLSLSNGTSSNRFMMGMTWLAAQLRCTVAAIGHPVMKGRGETGLPGETLFGASDFVWRVQAGEDSTADEPNGLILAEKVKSGDLFKPIAYDLVPVAWKQPPTDPDTGEDIPGAPLLQVRTRAVRLRETEEQAAGLRNARPDLREEAQGEYPELRPRASRPVPLPEPVPPSRPRRRTGILPRRAFPAAIPASAAAADGTTGTTPAAGSARERVTAAILAGTCPDCAEGLAGYGCDPGERGSGLVVLGRRPLVTAHTARLDAAVTDGRADLGEVLTWFPDACEPVMMAAGAPGGGKD